MGFVFAEKDSVFFIGGRGTKAGDVNAGGCTKEFWGNLHNPNKTLADVMGTNGEPISAAAAWNGAGSACAITESAAGKILITKAGAFADVSAGLIANCVFSAGPQPPWDGRYEVNAAQLTANTIEIDESWVTNMACDVKVGGAFDEMQVASDNTSASFGASPQNVELLTNKNETFAGTGDQIDIDAGGGSDYYGKWKRIIGIDAAGIELDKGSWTEFDGAGYGCHVFRILDVECTELRHIYARDSANTHNGFYITATGYYQSFLLKDCKSTGCKYGVYSDTYYIRGMVIMGGYYSSATGPCLCFAGSRWIYIFGAELVGSLTGPLIVGDVIGTLIVDGCLLHKTANHSFGIRSENWDTFLIVCNCVFYDIDHCIGIYDIEARLFESNNIFVLHTAATGKFLDRFVGAIVYSDYSCGWAIDGAPEAANRWGGQGIGEHSIEQVPQFVDAANGDFRLKLSSPAYRTGGPTLGQL